MKKVSEYKMVNGKMQLVTREMTIEEEAEIDATFVEPQPTEQDRFEAQLLYTALMTDTLI